MPESSCDSLNAWMSEHGIQARWYCQPLDVSSYQIRFQEKLSESQRADLASLLSQSKAKFEIEHIGPASERYLGHPTLGIVRQALTEFGDVAIGLEAIQELSAMSKGSMSEFSRLLRLRSGQHAMDLLEPYRYPLGVALLPKAV